MSSETHKAVVVCVIASSTETGHVHGTVNLIFWLMLVDLAPLLSDPTQGVQIAAAVASIIHHVLWHVWV